MSSNGSSHTTLTLVALLAVVALLVALRDGERLQPAVQAVPPPMLSDRVLDELEFCRDVGYLCSGLATSDSIRLLRWPDRTTELTIAVPVPPVGDPDRAESLRRAAADGVLRWQDTPLRLRVVPGDSAADIAITWTRRLQDARLGITGTKWGEVNGVASFEVTRFVLATADPFTGAPLSPDEVELVAVHEFGHALGLPHSADPVDVMYPEKTARFPTRSDWRTVRALYRSPNGAKVIRSAD